MIKETIPREDSTFINVSRDDIIYTAAIVDGEGWIGIISGTGYDRKRAKYVRYACQLRIGTTSKELSDWLQLTFGGGVYFRKSQKRQWKDQWHWVCSAKVIRFLLESIQPFLKIKTKQAKLALEYLSHSQENNPEWRLEMKAKMHVLNKRGKPVETNTPNSSESELKIESELMGDHERASRVIETTELITQ